MKLRSCFVEQLLHSFLFSSLLTYGKVKACENVRHFKGDNGVFIESELHLFRTPDTKQCGFGRFTLSP